MQAIKELKKYVNSAGSEAILKFEQGIQNLQDLITAGNVKGLSFNFENFGVAGLEQLEKSTNNPCLKHVFHELAELDDNVAKQLEKIKLPYDAEVIICNILTFKAEQVRECLKKL